MPAEGLPWLPKPELLTFEEIQRLVGVMAAMGVDEVRLTGGEPLVRRDLPELVRRLASVPGVDDLSLTTNGVLLDRLAGPLADAGLRRLNVSLDSLSHTRFAEITRRDALDRVLDGLAAAEREPRLRPIKVNCVAIRGFSEIEVPALARARARSALRRALHRVHAARRRRALGRRPGPERRGDPRDHRAPLAARGSSGRGHRRRARRYRFADGAGELGLRQPGHRAVLLELRPHPPDRRRPAAHLPVLAHANGTCGRRCATAPATQSSRT